MKFTEDTYNSLIPSAVAIICGISFNNASTARGCCRGSAYVRILNQKKLRIAREARNVHNDYGNSPFCWFGDDQQVVIGAAPNDKEAFPP